MTKNMKTSKFLPEIFIESLLNEATRNQLIDKSKNADDYKDISKGKNRYERRKLSRIANSVAQYNKIDMDAFFKRDILTVGIDVQGETSNYVVTMRFKGVLNEIQREVAANNGKLEFKVISRAMSRVFNSGDIQTHCSCPDSKYRQNYWQWKNGTGTQYEPRPSDKTNPDDTKGAGCKHTLLVLSNLDWILKVSSVVNNYIKYCQQHLQNNYATYMFPKIYGIPYTKAVQQNLFDTGLLPSDQTTLTDIASTNLKDKDAKGRWISGNKYAFKKSDNVTQSPNPNQLSINDFEDTEKELVPNTEESTDKKEKDTVKKEMEKDTIKREQDKKSNSFRAMTIDDYDDEGNIIGQGVEIKPRRKNKPGAGRPRKDRTPSSDQLSLLDLDTDFDRED